MPTIGKGVWEIRITDEAGQFRVIYIAKLKDAVYVLHCFQKKTQKLPLKIQNYPANAFVNYFKDSSHEKHKLPKRLGRYH